MGQPSSATRGVERGSDTKSSGVDGVGLAAIDSAGKAQLSNMYALLVLSSLMFDGRDPNDILELAADSVSSLTRCTTDAAYRIIDGSLAGSRDLGRPLENDLDKAVGENLGVDREIVLADGIWRYAFALRALRGTAGVLVVHAATAPSPDELFLLKALAQQTGAAMASAALIERERDQQQRLVHLIEERDETIEHLARVVSDLERHERIHEALIILSTAGAGEAEIAAKLHELTSLTVGIEDAFGNLRAWAGAPEPTDYRCIGGVNRAEVLRSAAASAQPAREVGRLFSVVRSHGDVLGVLVLFDPDGRAGALDNFTLDYGATVLALELSHRRALAQAELRRRRDLIEDLLTGTDNESAYARAEALEHNLRPPHCVAVLHWENTDSGLVAKAAGRWVKRIGRDCLLTRRHATTILVSAGDLDHADLHRTISADVGSNRGSIGIGSLVDAPSALPRSFSEAQRAFKIRASLPHTVWQPAIRRPWRVPHPGFGRRAARGPRFRPGMAGCVTRIRSLQRCRASQDPGALPRLRRKVRSDGTIAADSSQHLALSVGADPRDRRPGSAGCGHSSQPPLGYPGTRRARWNRFERRRPPVPLI